MIIRFILAFSFESDMLEIIRNFSVRLDFLLTLLITKGKLKVWLKPCLKIANIKRRDWRTGF